MKKSSQTGPKVYTASLPSFGTRVSYFKLPDEDVLFASDNPQSTDPELGIHRLWQDSKWYFRMPTVGHGHVVDVNYCAVNSPQMVVFADDSKLVTLRYYDMIEYGNTGAMDVHAIDRAIEVLKAWPSINFADNNPSSQALRSMDILAIKGLISRLTATKRRYTSAGQAVSVEKALALTHVPEAKAVIETPRSVLTHYGLDLRDHTYDELQLCRQSTAGLDPSYMTWVGSTAAAVNRVLSILFSYDKDGKTFTGPGKLFTGPYKFRPAWTSDTEGGPHQMMRVRTTFPKGSVRKPFDSSMETAPDAYYVKAPTWVNDQHSLNDLPYLTTRHVRSMTRGEANKIPIYSGNRTNPNYVGLYESRVVFTMLTSLLLDIRDHIRVTQAKFIDPAVLARMKAGIKHLSKIPLYRVWLKDTTLAKRLKA